MASIAAYLDKLRDAAAGKPLVDRSPRWGAVRDAHLKACKACQCCGTATGLEVHHIVPVHVDARLELVDANLVTLCRRCHLFVGHLGDWESWNTSVLLDCVAWRSKIRNRPALLVKGAF